MNVGDYVRIKNGYICKVININDFREPSVRYCVDANYLKDFMFIGGEDIYKSSPSIIDLIEVGDYVNGYYVEDIRHRYDGEMITILEVVTGSNYFQAPMYEDDIKSIVTKEQFESMEYKI